MNYTATQREAIDCLNQNLQIIACAGSGKTQVISRQLVNLIEHATAPGRIIAFTYTVKAIGELQHTFRNCAASSSPSKLALPNYHLHLVPQRAPAVPLGYEGTTTPHIMVLCHISWNGYKEPPQSASKPLLISSSTEFDKEPTLFPSKRAEHRLLCPARPTPHRLRPELAPLLISNIGI